MNARGMEVVTWLAVTVFTVLALSRGSDLLIPLTVALMVWCLLNALDRALGRVVPALSKLPDWLVMGSLLALVFALLAAAFNVLAVSLSGISEAAPGYQENLERLLGSAASKAGLGSTPSLEQLTRGIDVKWAVGSVVGMATTVASNIGIILLYVLFMIVEQKSFDRKFAALFPDGQRQSGVRGLLGDIQARILDYVWIKTILCVVVAGASYAILGFVGVDYAFFWSFVIFLLYYIPTIGVLLGVALPALLTLMQFPSATQFFIVLTLLGVVQFAVANLVEPRLLGEKLNLSPLVVIISLAVWGKLWGVAGMFLCVPLTVIAMIILAHFPRTRWVAVLLSESGELTAKKMESRPDEVC